jgi:dephospho-CoA kinase
MIIGLCGRPGAGKETLTKFLRDKGFVYFETSKIINEELSKLGIEITRTNQQNWADDLRKRYGVAALMIIMLDKTRNNEDKNKNYIFDSLRNAGEAEFLRKEVENFVLIGVDAPQKLRFERILKRNKTNDPKTWEEFLKVDERDNFDTENPMGQQTGKLLEMSDFVIVNDGTLEDGLKKIEEVWKKIEERGVKNINLL